MRSCWLSSSRSTTAYLITTPGNYVIAHAKHYIFDNNPAQKSPAIDAAQQAAMTEKRGIWQHPVRAGSARADDPPAPRAACSRPRAKPRSAPVYRNCDAVRAAGAAPIRQGAPGFQSKFDRDGDGVGCE